MVSAGALNNGSPFAGWPRPRPGNSLFAMSPDHGIIHLDPLVPCVVGKNILNGEIAVPVLADSFLDLFGHEVEIAVLYHEAQLRLSNDVVIRESGFAYHGEPNPQVMVDLCAFVVVHVAARCYDNANVSKMKIVPRLLVTDHP